MNRQTFSVSSVLHNLRLRVEFVFASAEGNNNVIDELRLLAPGFRVVPLIQELGWNQTLINHFEKPRVLVPVAAPRLLGVLVLVLRSTRERSKQITKGYL